MKNFSFKTKKNYHHNSSTRSLKRAFSFTVLALVAVFLLQNLFGGFFSNSVMSLLSIKTHLANSSATLPVFIRDRIDLLKQLQNLKTSVDAQSGYATTIDQLTAENSELRNLLGDVPSDRIAAGVIARPPSVPYDVLVLDRGSDDGIVEGALVYHSANFAIGYIERVFTTSAMVVLFSSPHTESTVYVYGPDVYARAYGEGGGVIRISVPQGVSITKGNVVILPMLLSGTLGTIHEVTSIPTQPEQHAFLTYPVPLQSIRLVSVETAALPEISFELAKERVESYRTRFIVEVPDAYKLSTTTIATSSSTVTNETASSTVIPE